MRKQISELKGIHIGRPAAILGGGPSLPDDIKRLPAGCIMISVNGHSLRLGKADYIVFNDNPYRNRTLSKTLLQANLKEFDGPRVSPHEGLGDYHFDVWYWDGGFTSTTATWLALFMGADPVLLCGMDCYQGEEKYFFDDWRETKNYHPCFDYAVENHLAAWAPAFMFMGDADKIKAVSGPLERVFGLWREKK